MRFKIVGFAVLLMACCMVGCTQQPSSSTSPEEDANQYADFTITFLLSDGNPAAHVEVVSNHLEEPTLEIADAHTTDERGRISFKALVPQNANFAVRPLVEYRSQGELITVDLQQGETDLTLSLSDDYSSQYEMDKASC